MSEDKPLHGHSKYTQEFAAEVCKRLAEGESLDSICRPDDVPSASAVRAWAMDDVKGFASEYAHARALQAEKFAEDIITIADHAVNDLVMRDGEEVINHEAIARAKLRVDTRKWVISKILPKKYGDSTTLKGDKDNPIAITALAAALDERLTKPAEHNGELPRPKE